jgi:predicted nucleic acid-binding Zn ribbon protein
MNNMKPIGKIIPAVLKQTGLSRNKEKMFTGLDKDWPRIMGEDRAAQTRAVGLKQNILQVEVKSTALLYELAHFHKPQILQRLRERYPESNFRDVNFIAGR